MKQKTVEIAAQSAIHVQNSLEIKQLSKITVEKATIWTDFSCLKEIVAESAIKKTNALGGGPLSGVVMEAGYAIMTIAPHPLRSAIRQTSRK